MAPSKSLKDVAQDTLKQNPSALGDPVSLKAETANSSPTENDRGAGSTANNNKKSDGPNEKSGSLADAAMKNPSLLGDPVSLKAESSDSEPTEHDRGAKQTKKSKL